jgi:heptose-I-phosphate ethanolaminephosphotransferase
MYKYIKINNFFILWTTLSGFMCMVSVLLGFVRSADAIKSWVWFVLLSLILIKAMMLLKAKYTKYVFFVFVFLFFVDIAIQGVLRGFFGANPSPSIIAESLANTNANEISGFFISQINNIITSAIFVIFSVIILWITRRYYFESLIQAVIICPKWLMPFLILITTALHFNPAMLRQQPLIRWPVVYLRHIDAQKDIKNAIQVRDQIRSTQLQWNVTVDSGSKTVVLVIGESDNRHNWSWYGYERATTNPLEKTLKEIGGTTIKLNQAVSAKAYTLPSLKLALTPATLNEPDLWRTAPDIFLLAKSAGYRISWLSNQVASEGWLSALGKSSDSFMFSNKGNWRDSSTTDFALLPEFYKLLENTPNEKELIVLHLLGQHFHYNLRCPDEPALRPFDNVGDDGVMQLMKSQGRSSFARQSRNEYDNAIYCGSVFLSKILKQLNAKRRERVIEFVYFSDHGQEVGHTSNYSGHSDTSEHGFSVPVFQWSNKKNSNSKNDLINVNKIYSTQYIDHLILGTLGIKSVWYNSKLDILSELR